MHLIFIAAILSCPQIKMINRTSDSWNTQDYNHLKTAQKRCGEIYSKSPCVKVFIKRSISDYSVTCSEVKK